MAPVARARAGEGVGAGDSDFGLPSHVLEQVLADPQLAGALSNPHVLTAIREVMVADQSSIDQARLDSICAQSPELAGFVARVVELSRGRSAGPR
jgi:hypothetical protein